MVADLNLEKVRTHHAPFRLRFLAVFIDFILFILPLTLLNYYNFILIKNLSLHLAIYTFLILFKVLMDAYFQGTPGKKLVGIFLTDHNYKKLSFSQSLKRNFFLIASHLLFLLYGVLYFFEPEVIKQNLPSFQVDIETIITFTIVSLNLSYFLSGFIILITPKAQALHDLLGKTFCVRKKPLD